MRFHRAYSFDAPCEQVYDLLMDEGFQRERVARTGTDPRAEVTRGSDADVVSIVLNLPTDGAPGPAKKFLGDSLTVTDDRRWESDAASDGARRGTVVVRAKGAPVTMDGTLSLTPEGQGCSLVVEGDLTCSIPLVGRSLEGQIAEVIGGFVDSEARAVRRRLGA